MKSFFKFAAPAAALLTLGGCATPFQANVSRFQQLPAPQGQTFTVRADDARLNNSLEFASYANLVAQRLERVGYVRASSPGAANMVVTFDYGIDRGREKIRTIPGSGFGYGAWGPYRYGIGPWGRPAWGFGRRAYVYGFYDPFWYDDPFDREITSYTVFTSDLRMRIERPGGGERLFEGRAQAQSTDNDLTTLVPNLIEAMFTNFPGNNGETVRITVAPPSRRR